MVISRKADSDGINKSSDIGTTFYRATLDEVKSALKSDSNTNIWLIKAIDELGFDAIDFKHNLFGSKISKDNVLYICITDGYEIAVNGKEIDPETALDVYEPDLVLSDYIKPATDEIILQNITEYEIFRPDFDKWGIDLLKEGNGFFDLAEDAVIFEE